MSLSFKPNLGVLIVMTEIVAQISRHINDLINLGKILSIDSNIEEMENKALAWMKKNQSSYWRGADMQVVMFSWCKLQRF